MADNDKYIIPANIISSDSDIKRLFSSAGISDISMETYPSESPFKDKRSMSFRKIGSMRDVFMKGPCRSSLIYTMDESWSIVDANLEKLKKELIKKNIYGFITYMKGEGATLWCLIPNTYFTTSSKESFRGMKKKVVNEDDNAEADKPVENKKDNEEPNKKDKEEPDKKEPNKKEAPTSSANLGSLSYFNDIIKSDIKGRRWMTAFNTAQKEMPVDDNGIKNVPFAISFMSSITKQDLPFFGRCAWGIAVAEGIVSITQIPLMISSNRNKLFVWSYVSKTPITQNELYSKFGKGGGEASFNQFMNFRKFINDECEPLNKAGDYSFAKSNDQKQDIKTNNTQTDSTDDNNENELTKSVEESYEVARTFLINEVYNISEAGGRYSYYDDNDDYNADSPDTSATFPQGNPCINKLGSGQYPELGPLF